MNEIKTKAKPRQVTFKSNFQWTPKISKFFILKTPTYLLKVTKFLVKISHFEFLVMTEKNIFVHKLFFSLNILDFSLSFFKNNCNLPSLKKATPFLLASPLSKLRSCQAPLFENLVGGSTPPSRRGCALCDFWLKLGTMDVTSRTGISMIFYIK